MRWRSSSPISAAWWPCGSRTSMLSRGPNRTSEEVDMSERLAGPVAVVTGARRGAGRGIAVALGSEAATVYVTARSVRGNPTVAETPHGVEDTADEGSARGGSG